MFSLNPPNGGLDQSMEDFMQSQVSANSTKGATSAAVVQRTGQPPGRKEGAEPPATNKVAPTKQEALDDPRAFFVGRSDVTVYAPLDSLLSKYDPTAGKDGFAQVGPLTLLHVNCDPVTGEPRYACIRVRPKGARKYESIEYVDLKGCFLSVEVEVERTAKATGEESDKN